MGPGEVTGRDVIPSLYPPIQPVESFPPNQPDDLLVVSRRINDGNQLVVMSKDHRLVPFGDGFLVHPLLLIGVAQKIVRKRVPWVVTDCLPALFDQLVVLARP